VKKHLFMLMALALSQSALASTFRYNYVLADPVPYDWAEISSTYGDWYNDGALYSCSNWSPSTATVGKDKAFVQTATDCKQDQKRSVQPRHQDARTGKIEDDGASHLESRTISGTDTRNAVGILENWSSFDPTYTDWTTTNPLYGCTSWSPDPSIYTQTVNFTQTSSTCKTDQERERQDREKELYTDEVRNSGAPVDEYQTLTGQTASRLYSVALGAWSTGAAISSCTNWSPDPATVTINQTFTQTATDCKQTQTRSRTESYLDHISGNKVTASNTTESQVATVSNTRTATGTKETWVATSSTYTAWTNTSGVSGCTAWSPSPSAYTVQTQFTQTGSGCSVQQSRTRQDRVQETTTGAIQNSGAPVTETQTLGGQSTTRSYLMDFSGWADSGGYYNCSAWTPDASTVNSGTAFTQTANCNINQTRGAAGYTLVNGAWASDPAVPYRTETQVIARGISQSATGTLVTQVCRNDASNYWAITATGGKNPQSYMNAYWDGVRIYYQLGDSKYPSTVTGGYTYTTPDSVKGTAHYTICRQ
jgi:hypothetical protein